MILMCCINIESDPFFNLILDEHVIHIPYYWLFNCFLFLAMFFLTEILPFWCALIWWSTYVTSFMLLYSMQFEKFTHQMKDGWGLATDENVLFGSDGTSTLYLINHQNFKGLFVYNSWYQFHFLLLPQKRKKKWVFFFLQFVYLSAWHCWCCIKSKWF